MQQEQGGIGPDRIREAIGKIALNPNEKAVLQLSGGKDSTALIYLSQPFLDRITVFFVDTGSIYPHVVDHVHETCRKLGAKLEVIRPYIPVAEYTEQFGLPSDIVPIETMWEMQSTLQRKAPRTLQSYLTCCGKMLFEPMHQAVLESRVKVVLRGSKKADARFGVPHGHIEHGISYRSPLWDWT